MEIKEAARNVFLIRKRHIRGGKHIAPMDFADYLRKSEVSESSKIYSGRAISTKLTSLTGIVILV